MGWDHTQTVCSRLSKSGFEQNKQPCCASTGPGVPHTRQSGVTQRMTSWIIPCSFQCHITVHKSCKICVLLSCFCKETFTCNNLAKIMASANTFVFLFRPSWDNKKMLPSIWLTVSISLKWSGRKNGCWVKLASNTRHEALYTVVYLHYRQIYNSRFIWAYCLCLNPKSSGYLPSRY